MISTLSAHRAGIVAAFERIAGEHGAALEKVNDLGPDLMNRLIAFASSGKLIRGSLVVATSEMLGTPADESVYTIAAALELVQSFLLVHDDIMDQDPVRRGKPSIHEQYRVAGVKQEYSETVRFGESMGICAGDVAVLLAVEAISALPIDPALALRLVRLVSAEIGKVGVAQMADVANGHRPTAANAQEIENVYRFKTGRYTFSLPMMLGAIYAGQTDEIVRGLSEWGELQGVVFQIRDDQLGVMSDTDEIGKPAGTDITSDKQTLHRLEFFARSGAEQERLRALFGSGSISQKDLTDLRDAMKSTGTLAALDDRVASLRDRASQILDRLTLTNDQRTRLNEIDAFNSSRTV